MNKKSERIKKEKEEEEVIAKYRIEKA